jgi:GTP diphosphokinase / guanosine-3',5'-bis(diphosphate) 3'-diphosphatase
MKNYLKEILKLRKDYPEKENKLIEKAYKFAEKAHKGQIFDGYKQYPYFIHPAYAGLLLAKWGRNYEEICAGLLHDVVEDCEISLGTIKRFFGKRVAFLVDGMSWEIKWNKETKSWFKDRPGFYQKIMDYSQKDIGVAIIHASDEISKLGDILGKKHEKKDENREKTAKRLMWVAKIMVPFYKEIGLKNLSNKVWRIKDYIGKKPKSELNKYISKTGLTRIKNKLKRIKGIEELR